VKRSANDERSQPPIKCFLETLFVLIIASNITDSFNMGKKDSNKRKRGAAELEDEEDQIDPELQAEIAAVQASRLERSSIDNDGVTGTSKEKNTYNKEGLIKSLEDLETVSLPFHETFQICSFDIIIQNENDDIEREVTSQREIFIFS
jgi:hypothetical protein